MRKRYENEVFYQLDNPEYSFKYLIDKQWIENWKSYVLDTT